MAVYRLSSPASYVIVLATRILVLTSVGLIGFLESWLIVRLIFGVHVTIFYTEVMAATVIAATFAATATSVVTCALFSLARSTRTFQNAINGPLYLLGGVLVPVTYLPTWLQPISRGVFFYWAADLLRGSLFPTRPEGVVMGLSAIVALGVLAGAIGVFLVRVMLDHLRRDGTMSLT